MICVDASFAAKWVAPEEHSESAIKLVQEWQVAAETLIGPTLLPLELTNILRQKVRRQELTPDEARQGLAQYLEFGIELAWAESLPRQAFDIAEQYRLATSYDAFYLAVAMNAGAALWTADRRLVNQLGGRLPFVRYLPDFATS